MSKQTKFFCVECGIGTLYNSREELLKKHPTLKDYPELIKKIEVDNPTKRPSQPYIYDYDEVIKGFNKFEKDLRRLEKLSKTCKYYEDRKEISIPMRYPICKHPKNRFMCCGHPGDCPILNPCQPPQKKGKESKK